VNDHRPLLFRLGAPAQREGWRAWIAGNEGHVHVHDTLQEQLLALIKCRNPKVGFTSHEAEQEIARHRDGRAADEVGVWVYYPWRQAAVRLLDEDDFVELRTSRNRYKITADGQRLLGGKVVGVVGLSVGGQIATTMALERTCGELRLADFDTLELSNLNRLREGVFALGINKAVLAARSIAEVDPFLKVVCYPEGLTPANLDRFLQGGEDGGRVDLLVEECDGLEMKLRCRQRARELGIPVVMEANDRGTLDIERFDREPDRPLLHGLLDGLDLSRVSEMKTNEEKVPIIMPMVGETTMSDKLRASMLEVGESLESWPQLASDVALGAGVVTNVVRRILLGELHDSGRTFVDLDQLIADRPRAPTEASAPEEEARIPSIGADTEPSDTRASGQLTLEAETLSDLLSAAAQAPSGGNEQPWRWVVTGPSLLLRLDRPFGDVLLSFGELPRRLALGAAAENVVLRAHARGLRVRLEPGDGAPTFARFRFFAGATTAGDLEPRSPNRDALAAFIDRRHTNRRVVPAAPLDPDDARALQRAVASVAGCALHVIRDASGLAILADVAARAERLRMLHPVGHRDLLREVRWTAEEAQRTRDGVDLATLELSPSEAAGLRMLREPGVARLLRAWRRGHALEKLTRNAIRGAAAVGLVTAAGDEPHDHFAAGRAIQRAWLTATRRALALQPHTSALYLFARAFGGGAADFDAEALAELTELKLRFESVVGAHAAPVFLFRVFPACEPPARALRRPLDAETVSGALASRGT
jgi:molybdopterin/thiamine biosynthesis adenylyltransferase